jgi:hypothetical protein
MTKNFKKKKSVHFNYYPFEKRREKDIIANDKSHRAIEKVKEIDL